MIFLWYIYIISSLLSDLEDSRSPCIRDRLEQFHIRRLESLRFWLLHAIGSIHTYLSGQVLQSLGFILEKVLAQADSLDTIISGNDRDRLSSKRKNWALIILINIRDSFTVHNEYLKKVHEHCLLTEEFEDLMTTINNVRISIERVK